MHELSLTQNLIDIAEEHAKREEAKAITCVAVEIGALSGVIPEAVEFAFEACTKGTMAEGATLEILHVPAVARCQQCDSETEMESLTDCCTECGSFALDIISGQEMTLTEMEIE